MPGKAAGLLKKRKKIEKNTKKVLFYPGIMVYNKPE